MGGARLAASLSVIGSVGFSPIALARSSPRVFVVVLSLVLLVLVGLVQKAGRETVILRLSALLFVLLCPWMFNGSLQWTQFRLVLPALFLAGIDAVAVGAALAERLVPSFARWRFPGALPVRPILPAPAWAVPTVLLILALSLRTLPDYTAYFYRDYQAAYAYFAGMPGQTIYSYGLRPYFLLGPGGTASSDL